MQCLQCGQKNPGTVAYCQKCGAKMDFTADEIGASLVEKAKEETAANTEHYAKQALLFAAVLFLVSVTLLILSLGGPENAYAMPSLSKEAPHVEVDHRVEPELHKYPIPIEFRKR